MIDSDLLALYNFDEFVQEKIQIWRNFGNSPALGRAAPDFPLWHLDGSKTCLSEIWSQHDYTIAEFGSFT